MQDRPDYWQLVKSAVEKEAKINFDDANKTTKPKATTHFKYDHKKTNLLVNPTVWMVALAPEGEANPEDVTPPQTKDSDSGESYEASPDDAPISAGDVEIAIRVAHASEAFSGKCFCCGKVGHRFRDEECKMYNPDFLNSRGGPAKTNLN